MKSIDDNSIRINRKEAFPYFKYDNHEPHITARGLTSIAIFNIFMKIQNSKLRDIKTSKSVDELLNNSIIRITMSE